MCVCACVRMWCVRACVRVCAVGWQGKAARLMTAHAIVQRQLWNAPVQRPKNTPKYVTLTALTHGQHIIGPATHRGAQTQRPHLHKLHAEATQRHTFLSLGLGLVGACSVGRLWGCRGQWQAVACSCNIAQKVVVPLLGFAFEIVQHTGMNAHDGEISG